MTSGSYFYINLYPREGALQISQKVREDYNRKKGNKEMAEENKVLENTETTETKENVNAEPEVKAPSIEELMTELAKEKAEKVKLKNSLDNASSEAAKYKKALREKQSAEEIQNEEKQKAEEQQRQYIADLETFKKKAEAKSRYALQGMTEELATQAAEAEVSGDYDLLARVHKQHTEALLKAKEAEWLKNRPDPQAGNDGGNAEKDPFLEGFGKARF